VLLFMISAESADIAAEYKVLLNELKQFNKELLHKQRVLAITKSDLIDDELEKMLKKELPKKVPHIFISSLTGKGLDKLKDLLWKALNEDIG